MAESSEPQIGQIVDHHFLWADEQVTGQVEGRKPRPCLIIAVERSKDTAPRVTVLPISSQPPRANTNAVPIPDDVKARIRLDRARPGRVVIDDANMFTWPGFDLIPQRGGGFIRATVTRGFFARVRDAVLAGGRPKRRSRPISSATRAP